MIGLDRDLMLQQGARFGAAVEAPLQPRLALPQQRPTQRAPIAVGANVTLMAQLAPAATVAPEVLVWLKFALAATLDVVSVEVPVLVSVTVCGALAVPTV
jgi:hypothetical protein